MHETKKQPIIVHLCAVSRRCLMSTYPTKSSTVASALSEALTCGRMSASCCMVWWAESPSFTLAKAAAKHNRGWRWLRPCGLRSGRRLNYNPALPPQLLDTSVNDKDTQPPPLLL